MIFFKTKSQHGLFFQIFVDFLLNGFQIMNSYSVVSSAVIFSTNVPFNFKCFERFAIPNGWWMEWMDRKFADFLPWARK